MHTCGYVNRGYSRLLLFFLHSVLRGQTLCPFFPPINSTSISPPEDSKIILASLLLFIYYHQVSSVTWKINPLWSLKNKGNLSVIAVLKLYPEFLNLTRQMNEYSIRWTQCCKMKQLMQHESWNGTSTGVTNAIKEIHLSGVKVQYFSLKYSGMEA